LEGKITLTLTVEQTNGQLSVADLEGVPWVPWNPLLKSCYCSIASVCKRSTQQRTSHLLYTCKWCS